MGRVQASDLLQIAVRGGNKELTEIVLRAVVSSGQMRVIKRSGSREIPPLMQAVLDRNIGIIRALLDYQDEKSLTAKCQGSSLIKVAELWGDKGSSKERCIAGLIRDRMNELDEQQKPPKRYSRHTVVPAAQSLCSHNATYRLSDDQRRGLVNSACY